MTTPSTNSGVAVTPELLARYDQPGPRYTSYPTAVEFDSNFGPTGYGQRLERSAAVLDAPLSLYVHLPFCESRCSFCGCHVVTAKRAEVADAYLRRVLREAALVAERLGPRHLLEQYHWGGGTPTYYPPDELVALHRALLCHFELTPDAEVAVEVDPRVTTQDHLGALAELGFNRVSMGVQDLDPTVQELIGRHQSAEETVELYQSARSLGFDSINLDLIYGLPGQDQNSFARTLEQVVTLRPDRLAVYSFAHLPAMRPNQRRLDESALPGREAKFELLTQAIDTFLGAGYLQIGMDHFALPSDDLSVARARGTLSRNFMGYTAKRAPDVVALGSSGISDVQGAYAQNHKRLASYYESVDRAELPIERGVVLSDDDLVRRHVITELMCNGYILFDELERRFAIVAADYFADELGTLSAPGGLADQGLAQLDEHQIRATELGELFIRNIAMVFDAYLPEARRRAVFSRTV